MGEGGEVVVEGSAVDGFDGLRHRPVERHPAGPGELVVEGRPHQGVAEAVAGARHLGEQPGQCGFLHGGEEPFDPARSVINQWIAYDWRSATERRFWGPGSEALLLLR
jgi:hypothetical protein